MASWKIYWIDFETIIAGNRLRKVKDPQPFWRRGKLTLPLKNQLRVVRTRGIPKIELSDENHIVIREVE